MDTLIFESYQIQNLELFTAMHKYINENIIELEDNVSTFNVMLEAKKVKWWEAVKAWFKQIFTLIGKLFAAIFLGKKYKITEIAKDSQKAIEKLQKEQAESGQIVLTQSQQQQLLQSQIKKQQLLTQASTKALPAPSLNKADQQKNLIDTRFNEYITKLQKEYDKRIQYYQNLVSQGKSINPSDQHMPAHRDIEIGIQGNSRDGKSGWAAYCKKMIESLTKNQNIIPEVETQITSIKTNLLYTLKVFQFSIEKVTSILFLLNSEVNILDNPIIINSSDLAGIPTKIMNYHMKNFIKEIDNFYKSIFKVYTNLWTAVLILDPLNTSAIKPLKLDKVEPVAQSFQTKIQTKYDEFKTKHNASDINKLYGSSSDNISKAIKGIFNKFNDSITAYYKANNKKFNELDENNFYDCSLSSDQSKEVRNDAYLWFEGLTMIKDNHTKHQNQLIPDKELIQFTSYTQICLKNIADFEMFIMTLLEYCKKLLEEPIICAS